MNVNEERQTVWCGPLAVTWTPYLRCVEFRAMRGSRAVGEFTLRSDHINEEVAQLLRHFLTQALSTQEGNNGT